MMVVPSEAQIADGEVMTETSPDSGIMKARLVTGNWIEIPFSDIKNILPMGV